VVGTAGGRMDQTACYPRYEERIVDLKFNSVF